MGNNDRKLLSHYAMPKVVQKIAELSIKRILQERQRCVRFV